MRNFIQPGNTVTVTAPAAVASGAGVLVGSIFGVAVRSAASGADIDVDVLGVFDLPKATGAAWTQGVRIYWDDVSKNCTTTVGTNKLIGVATAAALSGDTIGRVRLSGAFTL
jgi:predicted RecA/RadA family phage recombinase